jgi:hypothetical protein
MYVWKTQFGFPGAPLADVEREKEKANSMKAVKM